MPQRLADGHEQSEILIYGMNYAPEMIGVGRFTGEIGAYLAECGHNVSVITAPPHYPGWRVPAPYQALRYLSQKLGTVRVLRCPLLLRTEMRGVWRLIPPVTFALTSLPVAFWQIFIKRPKLVLCVEPTLFVAPVALLARLVGAHVVLHVQDLEIDAAFAVGHLKAGGFEWAVFKLESWLLQRFSKIITISLQMQKKLIAKGVAADRIDIVRNWVDLTKIKPLQGPNRFRTELGLGDHDFVVLYAGNVGAKQSLDVVLDAARLLASKSESHLANVHFVIAGDGPEKARLIRDYGELTNVHFLPLQPEERLCELLNLADLHVLPQSKGAADLVLPSKLGGMLASGKPVLVTADSGTELHDVLLGTAILVPAGDIAGVAREIAELVSNGGHPALGDGRKLAQIFARETCLEQFRAYLTRPVIESRSLTSIERAGVAD
jgi:colanic acid biosynthesis glycosyl transferase WcaI